MLDINARSWCECYCYGINNNWKSTWIFRGWSCNWPELTPEVYETALWHAYSATARSMVVPSELIATRLARKCMLLLVRGVQLSQDRVSRWDLVKAMLTPAPADTTTSVQPHKYFHFSRMLVVGTLVTHCSMSPVRISAGRWAILDIVPHGFTQFMLINGRVKSWNKLRSLRYILIPTISW